MVARRKVRKGSSNVRGIWTNWAMLETGRKGITGDKEWLDARKN